MNIAPERSTFLSKETAYHNAYDVFDNDLKNLRNNTSADTHHLQLWITFSTEEYTSFDEYDPVDPWAVIGAVSGFFGTVSALWALAFPYPDDEEEEKPKKMRQLNPMITRLIERMFPQPKG